jgi:hypothetical protein
MSEFILCQPGVLHDNKYMDKINSLLRK